MTALSPFELATGIVLGLDEAFSEPRTRPEKNARATLDDIVRSALRRPPCVITFSGGRDSSALLALAVQVARTEGLPQPIPITSVFPEAPSTQEHEWQERVVRHLGCSDWVRREFRDELDLIGPVAQRVMNEHGTMYPYNLHLFEPLMTTAAGGSFLTGLGGDQVFTPAGRILDVMARRQRPAPRDALRLGMAVAPRSLRHARLRRQAGLRFPWLRDAANEQLDRRWLEELSRVPLRWNARLHVLMRSRFMRTTLAGIAEVGRRAGTDVVHPFSDPVFIAALGRDAGPLGFEQRSDAMARLFGDVVPEELTTRSTKATFNEALWNRYSVDFVGSLDAHEVATALDRLSVLNFVDPDALLSHWRGSGTLANSFMLLQETWRIRHHPLQGVSDRRATSSS